MRVGGFYSAPSRSDLDGLAEQLRNALEPALETVRWVAGFDFPDLTIEHELLALRWPGSYPIERGTIVTSSGLEFAAAQFEEHVVEEQVPHSTALHARLAGHDGTYLTGPLARYTLNSQWLPPLAAGAAAAAGLGDSCRNPFRSIAVRAVEVVCAIEEAIGLIEAYQPPVPASLVVPPPGRPGSRRVRGTARSAVPALRA